MKGVKKGAGAPSRPIHEEICAGTQDANPCKARQEPRAL